jgi:ribosome-associated protein
VIRVADAIGINEREIEERFVRSSGPGGQNVNKVATAVELRFDIPKSSLPPDVKARLIALGGNQVTTDGVLLIDSRVHRSQAANRDAARRRLVSLVRVAAKTPKKRRPTKPSRSDRENRLASKKLRSTLKRSRNRSAED